MDQGSREDCSDSPELLMSLEESMEDLWATIRRHREDTEDIADICRYIQQDLDALISA
jgi:hypothetical protein